MLNKLAVLLFFAVVVAAFVWMVAYVKRGRRAAAKARRGRRADAGSDTYSPTDSYAGYSAGDYGSTYNQDASVGSSGYGGGAYGGGGDFGGGGAGGDFGGGDSGGGGGDSGGGSD